MTLFHDNTSYGNMVMPSNSNFIYKWQFAFSKPLSVESDFFIGIASTSITTTQQPIWLAISGKWFCFNPYFAEFANHLTGSVFFKVKKSVEWGRSAWENKIDLELDLKRKELSIFKYNGSERGAKKVLFNKIDVGDNIDYRLAVSLRGKDFAFSIVKFQKIY